MFARLTNNQMIGRAIHVRMQPRPACVRNRTPLARSRLGDRTMLDAGLLRDGALGKCRRGMSLPS